VFVREDETRLDSSPGIELRRVSGATRVAGRVVWETVLFGRALRRHSASALLAPYESVPLRSPCPIVVVAQNLFYHREGLAEAFGGGSLIARMETRLRILYYRRRMPAAYRRAASVIAVSAETARVLEDRASLDLTKTNIVFEGSDSRWLPYAESAERVPRLLIVSGLMPYKNLEAAIELFARVRETRPELELEVAGRDWRGYGDLLRERIRASPATSSVRFLGSVSPERLAKLYATSTLLIHLSECEAFGLPVLEAMRFGLPVVAANRSSLPEITGGAALLVDPDDLNRAASAVTALLGDRGALAELAAKGRARAASLTWRATAEGVATVLDGILEDAGQGS